MIRHVLLVDPDKDFTKSLKLSLANIGLKSTVAADGNTGLAYALCRKFAAILTNLHLPKRSGILLIEYLRQNTELDLPIYLFANRESERIRRYAELLDVEAVYTKPIDLDCLSKSIESKICLAMGDS